MDVTGGRDLEDVLAGLEGRGMAPAAALLCVLLDRTRERSIRIEAGRRLVQSAVPGALAPLIQHFREEADYAETWEYACVIGGLQASEAREPLIDILRNSPDHNKRAAAALALGELQDAAAAGALIEALSDSAQDPTTRGEAAEALAKLGAREAVPRLVQALHDPAVEVRFWATFALGQLGSPAIIPELERLLDDTEELAGWWSVGQEAADMIDSIRQSHETQK